MLRGARWLSQTRRYSTEFQSVLAARTWTLDLVTPRNDVYSLPTMEGIASHAQKWDASGLCDAIIGINNTKEVPLPGDASLAPTDTFTKELQLSLLLASLSKPYVAVMNGQVLGGLPGLAIHAPFRVATEQTVFQMPLGHVCGGGVHHMLARLDGALGPCLALTGRRLHGRAVFEQGIATHFIPERRIGELVQSISSFEGPREAMYDMVDAAIEELHYEGKKSEGEMEGDVRVAIDTVYGLGTVREMMETLERAAGEKTWLGEWAAEELRLLRTRTAEGLVVALEGVRRGGGSLGEVLLMEERMQRVYREGGASKAGWGELNEKDVIGRYFGEETAGTEESRANYGLPSEEEIRQLVEGTHPGGVARSVAEIELFFYNLRGYKSGVREKIERVVGRL